MDQELLQLKQADLRQYAASVGFVIDKRESSRGSTVMRKGPEKIIVSRKSIDGVFTYWNPHDDMDRGSIVDFVQNRNAGLNLGGVRKELRAWLGSSPPTPSHMPALTRTVKDLAAVRRRFAAMSVPLRHPYLEDERCIPQSLLENSRFAGRVRIDKYGAAVFPHYDAEGSLCGYEVKNKNGFTGFSAGGTKGLWLSNSEASDRRMVIVESAINALSHALLFDDPFARYGSIGGKPTEFQLETIRSNLATLPEGCEIVAAMDADEVGRALAGLVEKVFTRCGRSDLTFSREEPADENDWNDVLRARKPQAGSVPQTMAPRVG